MGSIREFGIDSGFHLNAHCCLSYGWLVQEKLACVSAITKRRFVTRLTVVKWRPGSCWNKRQSGSGLLHMKCRHKKLLRYEKVNRAWLI